MKKKILLISILLLSVFQFALAARAGAAKVLRIRDRRVISLARMIQEIKDADVILLGESHTSMADHRAQLAVIKALYASKVTFAIGLEMFRADSQPELDRWTAGAMPLEDFVLVYYDNWSAPWTLYSGIFLFARQARIQLVGLNLPSEVSDKVYSAGFDSLTPAEKKEIPPGITCTADKEYKQFIDDMYRMHHMQAGKTFNNFCEAQMLWDSVMAWHIVDHLNRAPGMTMVALAGIAHAWKKGIPAQIRTRSRYTYVIVLPEAPNGKPDKDITSADADYILMDVD